MAKSKKSKILAMALCASVMTGIYAAPVMAGTIDVNTENGGLAVTINSDGNFPNDGIYLDKKDPGDLKITGMFSVSADQLAMAIKDTDVDVNSATANEVITNKISSKNGRFIEVGQVRIERGSWIGQSYFGNDVSLMDGNVTFKGLVNSDDKGAYITLKGHEGKTAELSYKQLANINNTIKDGSIVDAKELNVEGTYGSFHVKDVTNGDGVSNTMIYTENSDGADTLYIDTQTGNLVTKGALNAGDGAFVANETGVSVGEKFSVSAENGGVQAVEYKVDENNVLNAAGLKTTNIDAATGSVGGVNFAGAGNIGNVNTINGASIEADNTGGLTISGVNFNNRVLTAGAMNIDGATGGLYVKDVTNDAGVTGTMIYTKAADGKTNTMWIDPNTGNLSTVGTISVGGELGGQAKTVIDGATGDIAVGITGKGTQMIHLDASTGSITAANFNGVTLATNDDQVLVGGYDISQMDETLGTVGGDVSQLRTDVNGLRFDVDGLRTDVGTLRVDVDRNVKDIGTLRVDVDAINSNLDALTDRVQNVEDKTQGISYDKETGTTTIDGNLDVKGDTETGAGGNENVEGNITAGGDITAEGDVNGTNGNFDKVTTGEISADKGNIGNSHFDENGITVGAAGGQHTTITDTTVDATNGYFDNLQADKADIGGVGLEGGTVTADKVVTGNTTLDNEGLNVGGQTSVTADGVNVGGNGGTTVSRDGVSIADKTIISDHDVVINEGTADRVSLSETADRVGNLEQGVSELNNRVGELEDRIDKVGAMAAAIANLRTMGYDPAAPTEVAVGIGQYRDETGAALGLFHYPNRDFMLSLSVSTSGDEVMGGIGATWKFGRKSPEKVAEIKKAQAEADARRAEEAKLAKAEEMKQAAKEAKIKAQQERHAKLAAERAAQAEAAK